MNTYNALSGLNKDSFHFKIRLFFFFAPPSNKGKGVVSDAQKCCCYE